MKVFVIHFYKITFAFLHISVLFGLYSNESGSYVVRDELQRMLQACENGYVPDSIASLFSEVSKIRNCLFMLWISGNIWRVIVPVTIYNVMLHGKVRYILLNFHGWKMVARDLHDN
jgi:hypothetical protein